MPADLDDSDKAAPVVRGKGHEAGESELQMCARHVAEQEDRIARQDILVERLRERRSPKFDDSLQLLAEMHLLLEVMHAHVARLRNSDTKQHTALDER